MTKIITLIAVLTSICFSQYSLKVEHIGGAKHAGEENLFRAAIEKNGKTIKVLERKIPFDVPFPATYINENNGTVVLTNVFDGFVEVFNAEGRKIWEQNFFKGMGPNYERTLTVALGSTSIAFLTSDVTLPNAKVQKFKIDGTKEWEVFLPYSMGNEIAMSNDEQTIVAGSYFVLEDEVRRSTAMIDQKGSIEGNADILFRKAAFSDDNKSIALTSEREIVLLSQETKKEIGRMTKKTDGIITDVIWNGTTLIVQESIVKTTTEHAFYYTDPTFFSYSQELKEIGKKQLRVSSFRQSMLHKSGNEIEFIYNGAKIPLSLNK